MGRPQVTRPRIVPIHAGAHTRPVRTSLDIPGHDARELDWLLFEQGGVLTSAQAAELVGRDRLRSKVANGQWRRLCRGVVVTHNGPLSSAQALWAAVLAAGSGAVLAGLTAAHEAGLRLGRPGPIHLLVPGQRPYADLRQRMPLDVPAVLIHRTGDLPQAHLQLARPMRTTLPRALVDAAQWALSDQHARTVVIAACQQRLVTPAEIRDVVAQLPRAHRRKVVLETVKYAEGGATALSEIDLMKLCRRYRLPAPDLQEGRRDRSGRNRYLDAYWRQWQLHVEVDGAHHMQAGQWEADMRRQNEIWIAGDRILRFSAWQARHRPDEVAAQLRAALQAAGWPG
jgi:very-short-patch-repair endonuclease